MRKLTKRITMLLMTVLLLTGILAASCIVVSAASAISYPKKVHGYPQGTGYIEIYLSDDFGYKIKNVKSSSKNLIAKLTAQTLNKNLEEKTNTAEITYYAKKKGNYTVKFDIVNASGKKVGKTRSVKVIVNNDYPIKNATLNGKPFKYGLYSGKTAKFKVTMNKGYTLQKIEVVTYKTKNENGYISTEEKIVKLGKNGKFTLGTAGWYSASEYGSVNDEYWSKYYEKNMFAPTQIIVYYKDKYTKTTDFTTYSLYKWAK